MQTDVYMCFVAIEKAFGMVRLEDIIGMLQEIGLDENDIQLLSN